MSDEGGAPSHEVEAVAAYVSERIGVGIGDRRHGDLAAAVARAMARTGIRSAAQFRLLLDRDPAELDQLVVTLTVRESYFFREAAQVELLRRRILPERRAAAGPDRAVRIWSAGCADGQEAYTVAILLEEEGLPAASILATDLSEQALDVARRGVYGKWSLRAVDEDRRRRYFRPVRDGFQVDPGLARRITFRELNLMDDVAVGTNDVVLCRNVLVYLTPDAVERVSRRLAASLAPGGWLLTASTDPYLDDVDGLTALVTPAGIVYRRSAEDDVSAPAPAPSVERGRPAASPGARVRHQEAVRGHAPASVPAAKPPAPSPPPAAPSHETREMDEVARARSALADADHTKAAELAAAAVAGGVDGEAAAEARVVLVRALANAGRTREAAGAAAEAVARFPVHVELRFLYALVLLESDRPDEAVTAARATLYLDPRLAVAHLTLGRAENARGNGSAAARAFRNALALLEQLPGHEPVPLADGEPAARLAAVAQAHLRGGSHRPAEQARAQ